MRLLLSTILVLSVCKSATTQSAPPTCLDPLDLYSYSQTDARAALRRAVAIISPERNTSGLFRTAGTAQLQCSDSVPFVKSWGRAMTARQWRVLPVEGTLYWNSAYPKSVNDGASWRGVGANVEVRAGGMWQWRFLTAAVAPEIVYNANAAFASTMATFENRSSFANPYHLEIDLPKRFGRSAHTTVSPGQSFVKADAGAFTVALSTENVWLGAAEVYPLLLSTTAPSFPHLRLGTNRQVKIGNVVNIEAQLIMGSLRESEFFDSIAGNDDHFFTTAMLTLEPRFLPGLYLSVARAYHDTASIGGQGPGFYLKRVFASPWGGESGGNQPFGNGIGALIARWVLPASGFEAYAEWSREDTPGGLNDLLREPDWTQAYVLGFQKVFRGSEKLTRLYGELIHLGESAPVRAGRGFFSYYTHATVTQGHTNEGQLLGAAIGPGSDAQLIGVDVITKRSRTTFRIERTRYDDDTYYRQFARRFGETRHDAEINVSSGRTQLIGPFDVDVEVMLSRRYDRDFVALHAGDPSMSETNLGLRLSGAWRPAF